MYVRAYLVGFVFKRLQHGLSFRSVKCIVGTLNLQVDYYKEGKLIIKSPQKPEFRRHQR